MGGFSSTRSYSLSYGRWEYAWALGNFALEQVPGYFVCAVFDLDLCYCLSWNTNHNQPNLDALPPQLYASSATSTDTVVALFDEDAVSSGSDS